MGTAEASRRLNPPESDKDDGDAERKQRERAQRQERHRATLEVFRSDRLDAFALGGLGLATWAALVTADVTPPVNAYSTDLLFVGATLAILGPVLFRAGGSEGTRMGLATTVNLGYAGIAVALGSSLSRVFDAPALHVVGLGMAAAVALREVAEVRYQMQRTHNLFTPRERTPPASS